MEIKEKPRTYGIRFSIPDGIVIVICVIVTWTLYPIIGKESLLFPYVLGHFFLFCNIFRISRKPELIWSGLFVVNFLMICIVAEKSSATAMTVQLPITLVIIGNEIRKPYYHGIACKIINKKHRL